MFLGLVALHRLKAYCLDALANWDKLLAAGFRSLTDDEQLYLRLLQSGDSMFLVLEKRYTPTQ